MLSPSKIFFITIALFGSILYTFLSPKKKSLTYKTIKTKKEDLFTFYNNYKIPVQLKSGDHILCKKVEPDSFVALPKVNVYEILSPHGTVDIFMGNTLLNTHLIKNNCKELYIGNNAAYSDIGLIVEQTRSTLGTSLPRLRMVNHTNMTLKFQIGSDQICIGAKDMKMYFGEENHGIHMGVVIQNIDGILQDFVINKPMTDLDLGFISELKIPLYTGIKIPDYNIRLSEKQNVLLEDNLLEVHSKPHIGSLADRTFIL